MRVPFPGDVDDLNATDFDILRCLYTDGPLWKMEVTRRINDRRGNGDLLLDLQTSISKQAVAKRMERLHELDYLETSIVMTDRLDDMMADPGRDFLTAYTLSEDGTGALAESVRHLLRDVTSAVLTRAADPDTLEGLDRYLDIYGELYDADPDTLEEFVATELHR